MTTDHGQDLPEGPRDPDEEIPPAPWSFKIMVALAAIYLAWRLIEGVIWVVERVG